MADFMPIKHELPILHSEITTLDAIKQLSSILQWCPIIFPHQSVTLYQFLCKVVLFDFLK